MNRRNWMIQTLASLPLAGVPLGAWAQGPAPKAGEDYKVLQRPAPVDAPAGVVEVVEFFWYSCPHCAAFEPALAAWVKRLPAGVSFRRIPVAFSDTYAPQQRLFYALQSLGLLEKLHERVFAAIHVERQRLVQPEAIADWVARQGVDKAKFQEAFGSFGVNAQATRANQLMEAYRVEGVPALGIAGRYYTDGAMTESMERVLAVADHLIQLARAPRG